MPGLTATSGQQLLMQSVEAIKKEWPEVALEVGVASLSEDLSAVSSLYQAAVMQLRSTSVSEV
jgi:hypothetical protein